MLHLQKLQNNLLHRLHIRKYRIITYCIIAFIFLIFANIIISFKSTYDFVVSDGRYYYLYLSSLVVDGDLDFKNQIISHWKVDVPSDILSRFTKRGYIYNKCPIGMALTLAPAFLFAHGLSLLIYNFTGSIYFSPDGYSVLYQLIQLIYIMGLGTISFILIDLILSDTFNFNGPKVFFAILIYWICSNYSYYFFREPFMVHIISAFWVTFFFYLSFKTIKQIYQGQLQFKTFASLILSLSFAIICRPSNVYLILFVIYILILAFKQHAHLYLLKNFPLWLFFTAPLLLQFVIWKIMFGEYIYYSYEGEGFNWTSPHLFDTIFSSRHGLLFWSPIFVLTFLGFLLRFKQTKSSRITNNELILILCFLVLWYTNSSWHNWWFGEAFGARAFIDLMLFFVLGFCFFFDKLVTSSKTSKIATVAFVIACFLYNYGLMALYITHKIPRYEYLF